MTNWLKQNTLSLSVALIIFLCVLVLFGAGEYLNNFRQTNNWWAIYFNDPKNQSLDFIIENHRTETTFHWEAYLDKEKFDEGEVRVEYKKTGLIELATPKDTTGKKVRLVVSQNIQQQEIYKNF